MSIAMLPVTGERTGRNTKTTKPERQASAGSPGTWFSGGLRRSSMRSGQVISSARWSHGPAILRRFGRDLNFSARRGWPHWPSSTIAISQAPNELAGHFGIDHLRMWWPGW